MSSAAAAPKATAEARVPMRARGHARVSAILDAAATVFAENGYEAATMTEFAARSGTAIGSLYRFFPTKAAVADAVFTRYATEIAGKLAALSARAKNLSAAALANALVDFMLDRSTDRAAALALDNARLDGPDRRTQIRIAARQGIAAILRHKAPRLTETDAGDAAAVILQMLKGARVLAAEAGPGPLAGLRVALRLYLAHCLAAPGRDEGAS